MENILLTINIILAIILVILVLFQQSEGGALGIGVSQENLTILSNKELEPEKSLLDKIEQNTDSDAPKIPQNN